MRRTLILAAAAASAAACTASASGAGFSFTVDRRVAIRGERFSRVAWAPSGGSLAATTFHSLAIVDASSGAIDTFEVSNVEEIAWSPNGRWLAVRATPMLRAAGRERRDRVQVVDLQAKPGQERMRVLLDTTLTQTIGKHPIVWKGPDLVAAPKNSAWLDFPLTPDAVARPGTVIYWPIPPEIPGASPRIFRAVVQADGSLDSTVVPPPPSTLRTQRLEPQHVLSHGWSVVTSTYDGKFILANALEIDNTAVYMVLGGDGTVLHRFDDGLAPSDLSQDGRWILADAEVSGVQTVDSSELFLVRVSDGQASALTGTLGVIETNAVFEPGTARIACIDQADGSILIGRIQGFPEGR